MQAASALVYISIINMVLISAASIRTIQEWFPWVSYPLLVLMVLFVYALAILFEHVFMYRSIVNYTTGQAYIKENPIVQDLQKLKKDMASIKKALDIQDE